jgi:hypothetical protein
MQRDKFLVNGKEQPLTIRVGESVVWVNKDGDDDHDATPLADSPEKFEAHPTNACFASWSPRILSLKKVESRYP